MREDTGTATTPILRNYGYRAATDERSVKKTSSRTVEFHTGCIPSFRCRVFSATELPGLTLLGSSCIEPRESFNSERAGAIRLRLSFLYVKAHFGGFVQQSRATTCCTKPRRILFLLARSRID